MKNMKRICAVALIGALLVLHGSGLAAPAGIRREASGAQTGDEGAVTAGVPQGYTTVAEKGGLSLAIDLETANIVVRDEAAGSDWYTSPPGVLEDESMSAHMAEQLASSLLVSFIDSTLNEVTVNSYDGSVKESAYEVRQIKDGLKITYDFSAESCTTKSRSTARHESPISIYFHLSVRERSGKTGTCSCPAAAVL